MALTTIVKSLPKILKLQALTTFFIFMISIILTNFYSGTFFRCYTDHLTLKHVDDLI